MNAFKDKRTESNNDESMITAVLQENEKRANRMSVYIFATAIMVLVINIILNETGVFRLKSSKALFDDLIAAILCMIPIAAYKSGEFKQHELKWIDLTFMVLFAAWCDFSLNYNVTMLMAAPIVLAVAYFSERTTVITYITTVIAFACSAFFGSFGHAIVDSNHIAVPDGMVLEVQGTLKQTLIDYGFRNAQYTRDLMVLGYVPKLLISVLLLVLAVAITRFGYDMLVKQAKNTAEGIRISTELKFAGDLQASALPSVSDINGKYNFEVAASMTSAKDAGGDFYDFTMIDNTHVALVIADVCGKGVPAAMFMMSAKEKLRSAFAPGRSPGEILYEVNNRLVENNTSRMFVTVWLGIVDITTGKMLSVNAGHEDPIVQKASGSFIRIEEKHGLGAGVRKDRSYTQQEYQLEPGDILIQYTDGVTEARNQNNELYGMERFISALNEKFEGKKPSAEKVNNGIRTQVADFVGDAEQSDDITTLVFKFL